MSFFGCIIFIMAILGSTSSVYLAYLDIKASIKAII